MFWSPDTYNGNILSYDNVYQALYIQVVIAAAAPTADEYRNALKEAIGYF